MFPLLNGEQHHTKVHLSQAYQQMELERVLIRIIINMKRVFFGTAAHSWCTSDTSIYNMTSVQDITGKRFLFKSKWKKHTWEAWYLCCNVQCNLIKVIQRTNTAFFYSQATDWVMEVTCKALNYFQKKWGYEWQKKDHAKEYIVTDPLHIQLIIIANFSMTYLH